MLAPSVHFMTLPAGQFRFLEWSGVSPAVIFLHGLSGVAEVWGPTVEAFGEERPRSVALDQRGHGQSPKPSSGYGIGHYVEDAAVFIRLLKAGPVHLVGHSMGARVAIVLAARHPDLLRSVSIVDIGPEIWKENATSTVAAFDRMPANFADRDAAAAFHRHRTVSSAPEPPGFSPATSNTSTQPAEVFMARLRERDDGSYEWWANFDALKQSVALQRARDYWAEWRAIRVPAMLIRGGTSNELRPQIAQRMRTTNPSVRFEELDGVGHNIPLLAPSQLAATLGDFWLGVAARS